MSFFEQYHDHDYVCEKCDICCAKPRGSGRSCALRRRRKAMYLRLRRLCFVGVRLPKGVKVVKRQWGAYPPHPNHAQANCKASLKKWEQG